MRLTREQKLKNAMPSHQLVRIRRRFEESIIKGYICGVSEKFFMMALVSDKIWLDGYECFRISDLLSIEIDPYAAFIEVALAKRNQQHDVIPDIKLHSVSEILASAGKLFPMLTIYQEEIDAGVCQIGSFCDVNRTQVSLLQIAPDAKWDQLATSYKLREITRVGFGASYENALAIVGGTR
jgi:DNA-binding Lrp family transcriptional regulator